MYNFKEIEKKWQKIWSEKRAFETDVWDFSKPKFYVLDMFPYPSGVGLHTGHAEGYTATDIVARMKRMQGYNVLHPMGFDSFGLPAEQYAIKTGNHPEGFTENNIKIFREQLQMLGFSYDWNRSFATSDPAYYKWTQWIFKQLFNDGLAKYIDMPVNWCEELGTVLANDEIIDGKSERGGYPVIRKNMKQWVIDIPKYAEELLNGLDTIDWPESTKEIQRNWIGKSVGALVKFRIDGFDDCFTVFTTRCDTLFGATYCVLSPEHELIDKITSKECEESVNNYKKICASKSDLERTDLNKDKTGVFTGAYAINPVNNKKIPIWISDYVLATYGTGAIMAVPAHDERDYEFAKKFNIEIVPVLEGGNIEKEPFVGDGLHINSEFLDGLNKQEAIDKMISWLEEKELGCKKISYRLRDWIFARQRYWGEPIPVVYYEDGSIDTLKDEDLPLVLPKLNDYAPTKTGASPLDRATSWVNIKCNSKNAKRETSTMPGAAGSSWYFLRYIDPRNDKEFANYELLKHWMPVDLYVGGPEHAVGHLLYSRMWNHYLYDKGLVPTKEPFQKLVHQGMILGSNGIKMGKRYPEYAISPTDIVRDYGADTLRLYEMFMGPLDADKPWNDQAVEGAKRFIERVWRLFEANITEDVYNEKIDKLYHQTVKKVTDDYLALGFNTAISQMMIFVNEIYKERQMTNEQKEGLLKLLNPVVPYVTEELWEKMGHKDILVFESWPSYDASKLLENTKEIAVQVNGKVRATIIVHNDDSEDVIKEKALKEDNVKKHIDCKEIVKLIVIKSKIVNIVVK